MTGMVTMKRLLIVLTLLSPALAAAQPADDPGLSETPPPKPAPPPSPPPATTTPPATAPAPRATEAPVPHSDASATVMAPNDESMTTAEPRETVDTQVQWVEGAGQETGDSDLYARTAAPTVNGPIGLFRTITGNVGRPNNF